MLLVLAPQPGQLIGMSLPGNRMGSTRVSEDQRPVCRATGEEEDDKSQQQSLPQTSSRRREVDAAMTFPCH